MSAFQILSNYLPTARFDLQTTNLTKFFCRNLRVLGTLSSRLGRPHHLLPTRPSIRTSRTASFLQAGISTSAQKLQCQGRTRVNASAIRVCRRVGRILGTDSGGWASILGGWRRSIRQFLLVLGGGAKLRPDKSGSDSCNSSATAEFCEPGRLSTNDQGDCICTRCAERV